MALVDAREIRPKAFVLIRHACKNRLRKGAAGRSTGYMVVKEHVILPD